MPFAVAGSRRGTLLGVATVLHWPVFNQRHLAFWLWVLLYFTTPFLVAFIGLSSRSVAYPPYRPAVTDPPVVVGVAC